MSHRTLTADRLVVGYEQGRPVLDGASLTVPAGRRLAVLGANGSGKTTLLRCLSGALKPAAGAVTVDGVALEHSRRGLRAHRQEVQLVLQDPDDQLFSASVAQDVSFGPLNLGLPEEAVRARVAEALDLLAVDSLAARPTHQLSYGERRATNIRGSRQGARESWSPSLPSNRRRERVLIVDQARRARGLFAVAAPYAAPLAG